MNILCGRCTCVQTGKLAFFVFVGVEAYDGLRLDRYYGYKKFDFEFDFM
jgi:hypothetical protein